MSMRLAISIAPDVEVRLSAVPANEDDIAPVNDLLPANVCAPVVTSPRADALAEGILKTEVPGVVDESMLKSVPEVPTVSS